MRQRERLKRAMRSYGPPLPAGAKRPAPLDLSAVAGRGVKDVLRATLATIDADRAAEAAAAKPEPGLDGVRDRLRVGPAAGAGQPRGGMIVTTKLTGWSL